MANLLRIAVVFLLGIIWNSIKYGFQEFNQLIGRSIGFTIVCIIIGGFITGVSNIGQQPKSTILDESILDTDDFPESSIEDEQYNFSHYVFFVGITLFFILLISLIGSN